MRLAAQIKGGYYPAAPVAIEAVLSRIRNPAGNQCSIIDPCAGDGSAIAQISDTFGIDRDRTYAIELSDTRSEQLHAKLEGSKVLAPADAMGCDIQASSFGFAWVNPPFDDEIGGGGRVETLFLKKGVSILAPGGILAFIVPEPTAADKGVKAIMRRYFRDISVMPFPLEARPYREVAILGKRRSAAVNIPEDASSLPSNYITYELPETNRPGRFVKSELLFDELMDALDRSPLNRLFAEPADPPKPRPPLPVNTGQLGLLLASGQLDGIVRPEGEPPHLVRGIARKNKYKSGFERTEKKDGSVKTTTIHSERIIPTIRAIDHTGHIYSFEMLPPDAEEETATTAPPQAKTYKLEEL